MTTLPRLVSVSLGVVLFAASAAAQDGGPRRPEAPAAPQGGADARPGRGAMIPPPRIGPLPAPWVEDSFQRTVELGSRGTVEVSNTFGEVRVRGIDGNAVRVKAVKRVLEKNPDAASALLQSIVIRISERGGGVEVFTELPDGNKTPTIVDYEIDLPAAAGVTLRSSGTIRVQNVRGELRAEAYSGHMVLTAISRVKQAKTYDGNLRITRSDGEEIHAETTLKGMLQLQGVRARSIELRTITGGIAVTDVGCERCEFKSLSGPIAYAGALRRNAHYIVESFSGDIRFAIDGAIGFDLEAIAPPTSLNLGDFPIKQTTAPARGGATRILRGTYGDASAIMTLRTFTGSISISKLGSPPR